MWTSVLFVARLVILVATVPMCSVITVTALVILPRTAQRKFTHQEYLITMTDCTPNHIMTMTAGTDHNLFITDAARENVLTSQGHTTNLNVAEAPATTRGMHPTPYPTTIAAHDTHPPKDTLGDALTGTLHTGAATTHPWCHTLYTRATLMTALWSKA